MSAEVGQVPRNGGEPPVADRVSEVVWSWRQRAVSVAETEAESRRREARQLRRRGLLRGGLGAISGSAIWLWKPWLGGIALGIAGLLLAAALLAPGSLYRGLDRALEVFARAVANAVSWLLLGLLYYLVFLPLGALLRALGKLDLHLSPEAARDTYWRPATSWGAVLERFRRQF